MEIEKKISGWGASADDFAMTDADACMELTVHITLHEYRELITENASLKQQKKDMSEWEMREEIKRLKNQVETLKEMLKTSPDEELEEIEF